jgi:hypothetical protein
MFVISEELQQSGRNEIFVECWDHFQSVKFEYWFQFLVQEYTVTFECKLTSRRISTSMVFEVFTVLHSSSLCMPRFLFFSFTSFLSVEFDEALHLKVTMSHLLLHLVVVTAGVGCWVCDSGYLLRSAWMDSMSWGECSGMLIQR